MIIYIKELDKNDKLDELLKYPKFIRSIIFYYLKITNSFLTVNIDEVNQKYLLINTNEKVFYKVNKQLKKKKLETKRRIQIVIAENLKNYSDIITNASIIDGKNTYVNHIEEVIEYITKDIPLEFTDVHILSNSYCVKNVNIIKRLSKKVKTINIITNDISKYEQLEELLLEEGISITVSNNKKKSLKKAKLIIDLDFNNEDIKKYSICRNSCIINLTSDILNEVRGFEGILINSIDVLLKDEVYVYMKDNNLLGKFRKIELYESYNNDFEKIEITKLYGNNGVINEKERLNVQKLLTK